MYAAVVPYRRTFLIVGGYSGSGYRNTIIEFDADHLSWTVRPERLTGDVHSPFATMVDDYMLDCD